MKRCCAEKVEDYFELSQAGTAEQDVKAGCEDERQHLPAVQHDCCSSWPAAAILPQVPSTAGVAVTD
jgi:hypothetical protein